MNDLLRDLSIAGGIFLLGIAAGIGLYSAYDGLTTCNDCPSQPNDHVWIPNTGLDPEAAAQLAEAIAETEPEVCLQQGPNNTTALGINKGCENVA